LLECQQILAEGRLYFPLPQNNLIRDIKLGAYTLDEVLKKADEPVIVNISSRKGSIHKISSGEYRILFPYQIAKAAQNMLTACLNQELKDQKIKTYAIHPGNLKTDVAPPDADTEAVVAAGKLYQWINSDNKPPTHFFYSVMDDTIMEW
jgi:NAD(P)-dependent dehydrogenase (short-subunit alcohol dehydrogenase family)